MRKKTRIEKAQEAYEKNDKDILKKIHAKKSIRDSIKKPEKEKGRYIGDFVYGALDGIITTFAVVSGVEGAGLSSSVLLILGFANLLADGISMSIGNYLSTKSELEYIKKEFKREKWEIENSVKSASKSTSGNWQSLGPSNVLTPDFGTGRINCLTFDPNDNDRFWVGAPGGGVWLTEKTALNETVRSHQRRVPSHARHLHDCERWP